MQDAKIYKSASKVIPQIKEKSFESAASSIEKRYYGK